MFLLLLVPENVRRFMMLILYVFCVTALLQYGLYFPIS